MATLLNKIPNNLTEYPNSFKRQGAFPLEAYSVFYSMEAAKAYASSNPISYVGQIIAVVENSNVDIYKIENEDGDLKQISNKEELNEIVEQINSQIENINKEIASKTYFSVQLVDEVNLNENKINPHNKSEFENATYGVIYLLPDSNSNGEDIYREYMLVQTLDNVVGGENTYSLILTGTTSTNLNDYVKIDNISTLQKIQSEIEKIEDKSHDYIISFTNNEITLKDATDNYVSIDNLESNYSDNNNISTLLNIQSKLEGLEIGTYTVTINKNNENVKEIIFTNMDLDEGELE